jgi:hypothetical protein
VHRGTFEVQRGIVDVHKGTEEVEKGPFDVEKGSPHVGKGTAEVAQAVEDVGFTAPSLLDERAEGSLRAERPASPPGGSSRAPPRR